MKFSPAIAPQVRRMIRDVDDGRSEIAAVWREVGRRARRGKCLQPSYESVRQLVHEQRRLRRETWPQYSRLKRAAILAFELVFGTRDPRLVILDAITGDDIDRRQHIYRRRARDDLSRTPAARYG
jgi:hypothetical protein